MKKNFKHLESALVFLTLAGGLSFFDLGCASAPQTENSNAPIVAGSSTSPAFKGPVTAETITVSSESTAKAATPPDSHALYYKEMKIENDKFDLPVEMNPSVEKWIKYFTGRGRKVFERYLERSEYFIPFLKPILKNAKAPEDLVYLAMIESGFNNTARSHARAVGAWQFMGATGRRYGLEVSWWVDERRDVEKSTIAAIQYLKELNAMFGSWHLAAASYNAGEAKIQRAIKKYNTTDFWELCKPKNRYLRPETKNYVPKLFAAAIVSKNRRQFGFEESYTKLKDPTGALMAAHDDTELEKLPDQLDAEPAPNVKEPMVEITRNSPVDPEEEEMLAEDSVETMLKTMSSPVRTPHVNKQGEVDGTMLAEIEVPSPADLFKVSSAAGLSYAEFKALNPELLRWITPPLSKKYKIRIPQNRKEEFMKKYFSDSFKRDVDFLTYKARKGDNPQRIAKRFGISPDPVAEMNGVSLHSSLMPGAMVELPIPSDFVRSLASLKSLDLIDPADPKKRRRRLRRRKHADHGSVRSASGQYGYNARSQHL